MKRRFRITTALLALGLLSASAGAQSDERDFWFLNNTGDSIMTAYVSPHNRIDWGPDILGQTTLENGTGTMVTFNTDVRTTCWYDFELIFSNGRAEVYDEGINVCTHRAVQFNGDTLITF